MISYDDGFYNAQIPGAMRSAEIYAEILYRYWKPESIVDVGCGRGAWLKAFKDAGAQKLVGYDGEWNTERMIDEDISFVGCNLDCPIDHSQFGRFDLAMSLEVAEHLQPSSAETFINSLTSLSDVVLFSAALPAQGGRNHINEQMPTCWACLFLAHGYVPFDIFRPAVWGNPSVECWYQQNTFLYVLKESFAYPAICNNGASPIANISFMDCVHPTIYYMKFRKKA
jgi:hypothetical protein